MKESSETSHSEGGGGGGYATIPYLYLYYNKHRKPPRPPKRPSNNLRHEDNMSQTPRHEFSLKHQMNKVRTGRQTHQIRLLPKSASC